MESLATNVERLKAYRARLILFPRRAGQHKKDDASKEDISAAHKAEHMKHTKMALPIVNVEAGIKEIKKGDMPEPTQSSSKTPQANNCSGEKSTAAMHLLEIMPTKGHRLFPRISPQ